MIRALITVVVLLACLPADAQDRRHLLLERVRAAAGGGGTPAVESISPTTNILGTGLTAVFSHTFSGNNRYAIIDCHFGDAAVADGNITAVTIGAGSATRLWQTNATWVKTEAWGLIAPATGSQTVTITFDAAFSSDQFIARAINFTNVNQTTAVGTAVTASGNSTTPSVTVSSASTELPFSSATGDSQNTLNVTGAGHGAIFRVLNFGSDIDGGASTNTGASSVAMSWSQSPADNWAAGGISIKAP